MRMPKFDFMKDREDKLWEAKYRLGEAVGSVDAQNDKLMDNMQLCKEYKNRCLDRAKDAMERGNEKSAKLGYITATKWEKREDLQGQLLDITEFQKERLEYARMTAEFEYMQEDSKMIDAKEYKKIANAIEEGSEIIQGLNIGAEAKDLERALDKFDRRVDRISKTLLSREGPRVDTSVLHTLKPKDPEIREGLERLEALHKDKAQASRPYEDIDSSYQDDGAPASV